MSCCVSRAPRTHNSEAMDKLLVFICSFKFLTILLEDSLCTHTLVKFVEEECAIETCYWYKFSVRESVTIRWNNRREYTVVFLYSGKQNLVGI